MVSISQDDLASKPPPSAPETNLNQNKISRVITMATDEAGFGGVSGGVGGVQQGGVAWGTQTCW